MVQIFNGGKENMRSKSHNLLIGLVTGALLAATLACGTGGVASTPTAAIPPTDTVAPSQTPPPLFQSVTLTSVPAQETSTTPEYTVTAQTPALQGSDDPRVLLFNNEMAQITQQEIASFKDDARMVQAPPPGTPGSTYDQSFELLSPPGNLISVKFSIMIYMARAAHPGTHSRTVTYDLQAGRDLALGDLFLPNSDYLDPIAAYCVAELQERPIGFDPSMGGAQPTSSNYGNWNVSQEGLVITFDEYQVAPYSSGPQVVVVPYSALTAALDPNGPLAPLLP